MRGKDNNIIIIQGPSAQKTRNAKKEKKKKTSWSERAKTARGGCPELPESPERCGSG